MFYVQQPDLTLPSFNDIKTDTLMSHARTHALIPLGELLKKLPSLGTSHYSPLVRSIWESVWGHPAPANKSGSRVCKWESEREGCSAYTCPHTHPGGIDCNRCFNFVSVTSSTMCLFTTSPHTNTWLTHAHITVKGVNYEKAAVALV